MKLLHFIAGYRHKLVTPLIQNTIAALLITASYAATVQLINAFLQNGREASAWSFCLWSLVVSALFISYCIIIRYYSKNSMDAGHQVSTDVRLKLCNHIKHLPLSFLKRQTPAKITEVLLNDMSYTESVFSTYIYEMIASFLIPCLLLILMFILDWKMAIGSLSVVLLAIPFMFKSYCVASESSKTFLDARTTMDHSLQEYLEGIRELKGANRTGAAFQPFVKHNEALQRLSLKIETRFGLYGQAYIGILELSLVVIFVLGSLLYEQGTLSLAVLLFFLCTSNRFTEPLQLLGAFLTEFRFALEGVRRVVNILDEVPLPVQAGYTKPKNGSFSFENVSFSYGDKQTLHDISFQAPEGSVTALVGESGSGKTTIANLLLRFWDTTQGRIDVGGTDIRTMEQHELYSLFSVVFQDVYLFNDTVMNNIRLGRPQASDKDVIEAAHLACCHDFIMDMENGYNTPVGQSGAMLSGGERQRIAIARAILVKAPILVLDEATASIDPENELHIQNGLNNLIQGRTLLVIAHRLSTIRYADQILVIKKGKIAERGTHDELIALKDIYHGLWKAQEALKSWSIR